jgi:hypothetical protein
MNKYLTVVFVAMVLLCAFAPTPAKADSVMDTFVWVPCVSRPIPNPCGAQASGSNELTWQAPASPNPSSVCAQPFPLSPQCFSITADVTGNGTDFGSRTITFGWDPQPATILSLDVQGLASGYLDYTPLWSGPTSSPTFLTGQFVLFLGELPAPQAGTLNISSATGVPEPSALLQTGAGLLLGVAVIAFWRKQPASVTCS